MNLLSIFPQAKMAILAVVIILAGYAYYKIKSLTAENKVLVIEQHRLIGAVDIQKETILNIKEDVKEYKEITKSLDATRKAGASDVQKLTKLFEKETGRLGRLAIARPSLIELKINRATKKQLECIKLATSGDNEYETLCN